jgi:hypothetical protein
LPPDPRGAGKVPRNFPASRANGVTRVDQSMRNVSPESAEHAAALLRIVGADPPAGRLSERARIPALGRRTFGRARTNQEIT